MSCRCATANWASGVARLASNPDPPPRSANALDALRQRRRHEAVEVAVEHVRRAGALDAGAQVLHQLIGLQHVGADLVAPADVGLGGLGALASASRFCSSAS